MATAAGISLLAHVESGHLPASEALRARAPALSKVSEAALQTQSEQAPGLLAACIDLLLRYRHKVQPAIEDNDLSHKPEIHFCYGRSISMTVLSRNR